MLTLLPSRRIDGNSPVIRGGLNRDLMAWWMWLPTQAASGMTIPDLYSRNPLIEASLTDPQVVSGFLTGSKALSCASNQVWKAQTMLTDMETSWTVMQVLKRTSADISNGTVSFSTGTSGGSGGLHIRHDSAPIDAGTSPYAVVWNNGPSPGNATSLGVTIAADQWFTLWVGYVPHYAKLAINDAAWITDGTDPGGTFVMDTDLVGARYSSGSLGRYFGGVIAETRLYSGILSNQQRAEIYRDMLTGYKRTLRFTSAARHVVPASASPPATTDHFLSLLGVGA